MTLNDICELIVDCPHVTDNDEGFGYPLIRTPNVGKGMLLLDNVHRVSQEVYERRNRRAKPQTNDIILAREAPAGNVALIREGQEVCLGQRTVLIRPNQKIVDSEFLTYYLLAPYNQHRIKSSANGSTVEHVNMPNIRGLKVELPSIEKQEKIASILSNYDTLIDINTKRIKLLEDSARELYKEWFVRMRFPGHEQTKFVKGIPEGWKVKELKELVSTQYGLTTTAHNEKGDNDAYYLRITDIVDNNIDWSSVPYCTIDDTIMGKYKLYPGDILVARTGATVGYATQIQKFPYDAVFASYLIRLKAKNSIHSSYIGMSVVSDLFKDYIQSIATGAAQPMANPRLMTTFKLLLPDDSLLKEFNEKVDLMNEEILTLQLQNQSLTATRDRLLPRLLSGELKINA